jgi:LysR family transcriptional regulator, transcription activator of glutamate synthase operon
MELLQLKYFYEVAQSEHLTQTSEKLHVSSPSLSMTISKLEESLGVRLFDHVGRNIRLNEYGKLFYQRVTRVLNEIENAKLEINDLKTEKEQIVRIGINSLPIWTKFLENFQKQHPEILIDYFSMTPQELEKQTYYSTVDYFLGVKHDIPVNDYEVIQLGPEEKPVVLLSTAHTLAKEKSINLLQLQNDVILSLGKCNPSAHQYILDLCSIAGFTPKQVLECDYFFRLQKLADNKGVAITTDLGEKFIYIDSRKVKAIPVSSPILTRTQSIAWRKDHFLTKTALTFRQFLEDATKNRSTMFYKN